jgi:hypothetical protein
MAADPRPTPSRARIIRRRYTDVPFATVIGWLGVNNLITLVLHPTQQAASQLAGPLAWLWGGLYGAGGLLILAGLGGARANLEAAGCVAYGGGAAVAAVATAAVRGGAAWNQVGVLLLFAAFATIRAYHLARGRILVLIDVDLMAARQGGG